METSTTVGDNIGYPKKRKKEKASSWALNLNTSRNLPNA
jgi:hypothetical protein